MEAGEEVGVRCGARFVAYQQLFARRFESARGLANLHVARATVVALLLRNSIEFLEASIATVPLGANAVPINWHWRGDEIATSCATARRRWLVLHATCGRDRGQRARGGDARRGRRERREQAAGGRAQLLGADRLERALEQPPESAPVSIIYTSGTTGRPKGVVRTPATDEQREATQALLGEIFQLGRGERTVIRRRCTTRRRTSTRLASAIRGMDMTIMESFDAEEFLRIVQDRKVTVVQMVPTMFVRMLALPVEVRSRYDIGSLRWVVHAAAPCPPDVKRAIIEWLRADRGRVLRAARRPARCLLHERGVARPPGTWAGRSSMRA